MVWAGFLLVARPCAPETAAAAQDRHDPKRSLRLAECLMEAGDKVALAQMLPRPGGSVSPALRFALGTKLAQHGYFREAIRQFEAIPAADRDAAVTFDTGLAYSRLREFGTARRYYFSTIDLDPDNVEAYFRIGLDFAANGETNLSIPWLLRARRMAPARPDIGFAVSEELLSANYFQSAEGILQSAIALNSKDPLLRVAQGDAALGRQQFDQAAGYYRQALAIDPALALASVGLARAIAANQQQAEATEILHAVLAREPSNSAGNAELGRIEAEAGQWQDAIPRLEIAKKADPGNSKIRISLARCYRRSGRADKALEVLSQVSSPPPDRAYHLEIAQAYQALKRAGEARREMETVRQMDSLEQKGLKFVPPSLYIH